MTRNLILISIFLYTFLNGLFAQPIQAIVDLPFALGNKTTGGNFLGTVWINTLSSADSSLNASIGNVVFEPGARTKWHLHPGGQTLVALGGAGYYQELGQSPRALQKGDIIKCPPGTPHWHGASADSYFIQMAITKEHTYGRVIWLGEVLESDYQNVEKTLKAKLPIFSTLSIRHQFIVKIAALTAAGELGTLARVLSDGLDEGLTVNELKEVLIHVYAYAGFPRSIQGITTLMTVLDNRNKLGIQDKYGEKASSTSDTTSKYERGRQILEKLTGQTQISPPKSGYGAFSPEIDVFLKEHLFADIFERGVLSFIDREVATIGVLSSLGGVAPMLKGHLRIALYQGLTEDQLEQLILLIEPIIGAGKKQMAEELLEEVVNSK